jgi:hypothetical protein
MNMSEENKHNSFFPAEDSPISVPPAGEAWSLMKQKLDAGMPVAPHGHILFRGVRWLTPGIAGAAVTGAVVLVSVSIWLATRKPLHREADFQKVERADAARRGNLSRRGDSVVPQEDAGVARQGGDRAAQGSGETPQSSGGTPQGNGETPSPQQKSETPPPQGNGVNIRMVPGDQAADSGRGATFPKNSVARLDDKIQGDRELRANSANRIKEKTVRHRNLHPGLQGEKPVDARAQGKPASDATPAPAGINPRGPLVTTHERPRGGPERHRNGQTKPVAPPLATVESDHGDPAALAASLAGELKARQRAWAAGGPSAKGSKPQPGKGAPQARKPTAGQAPARPGERILAAGIWDGTNFAVNNQVTYRYTSSDGPYLLPDHLPGAYMRLYMGDRVYIEAGLRIFSPQYTRLQQIDSTGDTTSITPTGVVTTDTVVTLKKLYYTDIPLTMHYRVFAGLYLGGGVQYSRLWDGAAVQNITGRGNVDLDLKVQPVTLARLQKNDWRVLLDASYVWRRLSLGLRYQEGLGSYLRTAQQGSKPHNSSLSLSLSYDIWRQQPKRLAVRSSLHSHYSP